MFIHFLKNFIEHTMTKVYASQIKNLSDARYFSSMEVDFLGISLQEPADIYKAYELMSWVEGPMTVAEPRLTLALNPDVSFEKFDFVLSPKDLDFLPVPDHRIISQYSLDDRFFNEDYLFILSVKQDFEKLTLQDFQKLQNILNSYNNVILSIPFDVNNTAELIANLHPPCIIVTGGEEEKTGFKSFEELDIFFEQIGRI